ncbi:hypothetical protein [Cryobacterium sp. Hb1]|uniref:hypothetical protein n=1 Tax=Cryobacterium sp. Hb1 TaxID=1259147 RepID=UPI00106C8CB4|nr:hypothetical protein [Cryobacterium sp. Hb1]TFD70104.1 hypothetical protein E3T38_06670 [Cryobacterium sp. Hb1]
MVTLVRTVVVCDANFISNIRHSSAFSILSLINKAHSTQVSVIGHAPTPFFRVLELTLIAIPKTQVLRR